MWSARQVAAVVAPAEDPLKPRHVFDRGVPDFSAGAVGGSHPPARRSPPMALSDRNGASDSRLVARLSLVQEEPFRYQRRFGLLDDGISREPLEGVEDASLRTQSVWGQAGPSLSGERSPLKDGLLRNAQSSEVIKLSPTSEGAMGVSAERWCSCGTKRRCQTGSKAGKRRHHVVAVSWDERHLVAVAEVALVFCLDLARVGRRATGGGGPAIVAGQSWGVVRQVGDRDFSRSRSRFMTSNCPIPPAWSLLLTDLGSRT
jgi:hypothetical protein